MSTHLPIQQIVDFWFVELDKEDWFSARKEVNDEISQRFGTFVERALEGAYTEQALDFSSTLALILLLDQFTRNIFPDEAKSFAGDKLALQLARQTVAAGWLDVEPSEDKRTFALIPFMHSENLKTHEEGMVLFAKYGSEFTLKFAKLHLDIIQRFGRYPHRNAILGRENTAEEITFLTSEWKGSFENY